MLRRVRVIALSANAARAQHARVGILKAMAGAPSGFEFTVMGERIEIRHHGRLAATLRKSAAVKFLDDVERGDPQQVMARVTGNYRRGNERSGIRRP